MEWNKVTWYSRLLAVIVIVCTAILIACFTRQYREIQNIKAVVVTTAKDNSIDTSDWKTYKNEKYGFELTFPESWKGFSVNTNTNSVDFGLGSQSRMFSILILTEKEWREECRRLKDIDGDCTAYFTAKNNNFIFQLVKAQDYADEVAEKDISNIYYSIKFTK